MSWRRFLNRRYWDNERAREIEAYLEIETADNVARGMSPREAASAARRTFGNPTLVREEIYRMNTVSWLESILQDIRNGWRLLLASPGFAVVAIASLALGIGANTAVFQLVNAVRLRELPIKDPKQLAEIKIIGGNGGLGENGPYGELTLPIWEEIRRNHPPFSEAFAWSQGQETIGEGSSAEVVDSLYISGEGFGALGLQPWRGRLLALPDEHPCPTSTVVVSYGYWQSKMGGRLIDAGSKLLIDGQVHQVVGVAPPSFFGLVVGDKFDIALPFCLPKELARNVFNVNVMGRLKQGWTLSQATARLTSMSPGIMAATEVQGYDRSTIERYRNFRLGAFSASSGVSYLRETYERSLWLLLGITGLVLLIACVNLANLLLARATTREREMAVRLALGAGRSRLLRQLLVETSLLAIGGTGLGIGLAQLLSRALVRALSTEAGPVNLSVTTDHRVLSFAIAAAVLTCLVFGAVPALRASAVDPVAAMKSGARGTTATRERFSLQRSMIVAQISISLVLLIVASLFVRSFYNLMSLNPGMREQGITVAFLGLQSAHLAKDHLLEFERQLVDDVETVPGIASAATTTMVPLLGGSWGHGITAGGVTSNSKFTWVSPDYFSTMGIPILKGRGLSKTDTQASQRVAVVNQAFAHRFFNSANPIGQTLRTHPEPNYPPTVYEIVGVIPDTLYNDMHGDKPPNVFAPALQFPDPYPWTAMLIRSNLSSADAAAAVKQRIALSHPGVIVEAGSFETRVGDSLVRERVMAALSGFFGVIAVILATIGLYGVISYFVTRRHTEIGIRIAIGAHRTQVLGMIMREAALLLALGVVAGTALAIAAGREAASLLFNLKPYDPVTLAGAVLLLAAIGGLASFLPARRAAKLDPVIALRCE